MVDVHPRADVALDEVTQLGFHCSKALAWRAASMFWLSCRTTFAL